MACSVMHSLLAYPISLSATALLITICSQLFKVFPGKTCSSLTANFSLERILGLLTNKEKTTTPQQENEESLKSLKPA